jgi:hypothetical protein
VLGSVSAFINAQFNHVIERIVAGATRLHPRANMVPTGGLTHAEHGHLLSVPPNIANAPAGEGVLLQRLESARLDGHPLYWNRASSDADRAVRIMRDGRPDPDAPMLRIGAAQTYDAQGHWTGGNYNGALTVQWVDAAEGATRVLVKPPTPQSRNELLAGGISRRVGFDHLVPPSAVDGAGATRIEFRPGQTAHDRNIHTAHQLEAHLTRGYAARLGPGHDWVASRLARFDAQSMRAMDYVLGNWDRNARNVLIHDDGTATFIDHEFVGFLPGSAQHPLKPVGVGLSRVDDAKWEQLDDPVLEHMRRHFTEDALRRSAWDAGIRPGDPRLEGMVQRLDHMRRYGFLEWSDTPPRSAN